MDENMSEYKALLHFNRQAVNLEMVHYLASTTASVIHIRNTAANGGTVVSLVEFIKALIKHSNVQTPTLMATTVYLIRLRSALPADVHGMETTRHRMFIGCLILAAKNLNDSSPLNKHWTQYTDGLFDIDDINTIERELLDIFDWNLNFTTSELITSLSHFIIPIQCQLSQNMNNSSILFNSPTAGHIREFIKAEAHSRSSSHMSIPSLSSSNTISTMDSSLSSTSSNHKLQVIKEEPTLTQPKRKFGLTKPIMLNSNSYSDLKASPAKVVTSKKNATRKSSWASIFH